MRKALYRKYRPTKLSEVVGEEHITDALASAIKKHNFSHTYLFVGPRGTGKTSVARIFAHEINGFPYEVEDQYVDIIEMDAASHTSVEDVREISERAVIAPTKGKYKVYIIDEIHMLSKSAFNALLKTLEEPPAHVVFIMATTDVEKLPNTILSRSQVFNFRLASPETMKKHLGNIAKKESIEIDDDALALIVERGGGSFRDSLTLLDQISTIKDRPITKAAVENTLGLPKNSLIEELLSAYQSADLTKISDLLGSAFSANLKPDLINSNLIDHIIKTPSPDLLPLLAKLSDIKPPFIEAKLLVALAGNLPTPQVAARPVFRPAPAPKPTPAAPAPEPTAPVASSAPSDFNWNALIDQLKASGFASATILSQFDYQIEQNTLYLISGISAHRQIIGDPKRLSVIADALGNAYKIQIVDAKEFNASAKKDPTIAQISAIMGEVEEVKNNAGDNLF